MILSVSEAFPEVSAMMIVSKTGEMQVNIINAVDGCACEDKYLRLRNAERKKGRILKRISWVKTV